MDSDKINRWLTLGANIGVLIGIILLIAELNQSSIMMRGQTRHDVASELVGLQSQVANNPQLADLIYRTRNGEALTPQEMVQYTSREIANFRYFEDVYYQYRQGLYEESEYSAQTAAWKKIWTQAKHDIWCDYRTTVSPGFRAEIDSLISNFSC